MLLPASEYLARAGGEPRHLGLLALQLPLPLALQLQVGGWVRGGSS